MAKGEQVGVLWEKDSKFGGKYYKGTIKLGGQEIKVVIYETHPGYRKEKSPTHKVYLDVPKEDEGAF